MLRGAWNPPLVFQPLSATIIFKSLHPQVVGVMKPTLTAASPFSAVFSPTWHCLKPRMFSKHSKIHLNHRKNTGGAAKPPHTALNVMQENPKQSDSSFQTHSKSSASREKTPSTHTQTHPRCLQPRGEPRFKVSSTDCSAGTASSTSTHGREGGTAFTDPAQAFPAFSICLFTLQLKAKPRGSFHSHL